MFQSLKSRWAGWTRHGRNWARTGRSYATYHHFGNKTSRTGSIYQLSPKMSRTFKIGGAVVAVVVVTHIEEAPVTHRLRLMLTPASWETYTANRTYRSLLSEYQGAILPAEHPTTARVRSIMMRLIHAAEHYIDPETGEHLNLFENLKTHTVPPVDWKIHVIDDVNRTRGPQTPNAFVIGDGKVFVFRSILPLTANDDGLATVLSHELGHLLAHHMQEKMSKSPVYMLLEYALVSVFGDIRMSQILTTLMFERPGSRGMETEADYIGLMVMSLACFKPQEAPRFWDRMVKFEQRSGGSVPELLSTHPKSERRQENIREWMPKAEKLHELANCGGVPFYRDVFARGF